MNIQAQVVVSLLIDDDGRWKVTAESLKNDSNLQPGFLGKLEDATASAMENVWIHESSRLRAFKTATKAQKGVATPSQEEEWLVTPLTISQAAASTTSRGRTFSVTCPHCKSQSVRTFSDGLEQFARCLDCQSTGKLMWPTSSSEKLLA